MKTAITISIVILSQGFVYAQGISETSMQGHRIVIGAPQCTWPSDFNLIRDSQMLQILETQNFTQLVEQGGVPIENQIAAGEAQLSHISDSLPSIEADIRGISSPTITHYNFRFNYENACKKNPNKDALLASECQHVNAENAVYALNGTLQIMDCMAGRTIRPSIGPNHDTQIPQDELPGATHSSLVSRAQIPQGCDPGMSSGDTATAPSGNPCPRTSRPGDPKPGDKVTK